MSHEKYCVLVKGALGSVCVQAVATFELVTIALPRAVSAGT
jgi:hypothetical protein